MEQNVELRGREVLHMRGVRQNLVRRKKIDYKKNYNIRKKSGIIEQWCTQHIGGNNLA